MYVYIHFAWSSSPSSIDSSQLRFPLCSLKNQLPCFDGSSPDLLPWHDYLQDFHGTAPTSHGMCVEWNAVLVCLVCHLKKTKSLVSMELFNCVVLSTSYRVDFHVQMSVYSAMDARFVLWKAAECTGAEIS